jgi:hypothetical protein
MAVDESKKKLRETIAKLESDVSVLQIQGNHKAVEITKKMIDGLKKRLNDK